MQVKADLSRQEYQLCRKAHRLRMAQGVGQYLLTYETGFFPVRGQ